MYAGDASIRRTTASLVKLSSALHASALIRCSANSFFATNICTGDRRNSAPGRPLQAYGECDVCEFAIASLPSAASGTFFSVSLAHLHLGLPEIAPLKRGITKGGREVSGRLRPFLRHFPILIRTHRTYLYIATSPVGRGLRTWREATYHSKAVHPRGEPADARYRTAGSQPMTLQDTQ